ncbi:MAG: hypothetical protein HYZ28_03680 [Myxococcales bacterium]|nr:hypothetical protein [Myxococcales bacterium]
MEAAEPSAPAADLQGELDSSLQAKVSASFRLSAPAMTPFLVDDVGTKLSPTPLASRIRARPELRYGSWGLVTELDVASGTSLGVPQDGFAARTPYPGLSATELRQLFLEYRAKTWVLRAGQQATNWGLGLVANAGAADPEPGRAFGDSRFGDLSYRLLLGGRPLFGLGGAFRAIEPAVGVDMVVRDDTADYWAGDRALQGILALRFAVDAERNIGVYTVVRRQRPAGPSDGGRETDALVLDVAGKWQWGKRRKSFSAGFEVVSIDGTTTQARRDNAARHKVRQLGAALELSATVRSVQSFLDIGYASGDQNPFDDRIEGFRFDPDYNVGLVLFEEVLGWQSARASARAADPMLVGRPPEGVDLLPTRGAVTGAWYVFPRARVAASDWLDLYGGPLLAYSTARLVDPFNTQLAGGEVRNSLGGPPMSFLGTELDVGAQARWKPLRELLVTGTAEGGLFLPGDAFADAKGGTMPPVLVGRLRLSVNL